MFRAVVTIICVSWGVSLLFYLCVGVLGGSLITSAVKLANNDCGKQYGVESAVISGDWFCPKNNIPGDFHGF